MDLKMKLVISTKKMPIGGLVPGTTTGPVEGATAVVVMRRSSRLRLAKTRTYNLWVAPFR